MVSPNKRKATTNAQSQPPRKLAMTQHSADRHPMAETQPEVLSIVPTAATDEPGTSLSETESMLTDHVISSVPPETTSPVEMQERGPDESLTGNCDPLLNARTSVEIVTHIENVTSENEDVFTQILTDSESSAMFENCILDSYNEVRRKYRHRSGTLDLRPLPSRINKKFSKTLIQNINIAIQVSITTKKESSIVESLFAKYNINELIKPNTESNEKEDEERALIQEEVLSLAKNIFEAGINEVMKSTEYQAAVTEFSAALRDILQAEPLLNLITAFLSSAARDVELKTSLANLIQKKVMESGRLKEAAQNMATLMSSTTSTERLEKWVREIRDCLVGKLQRTSQAEPAPDTIIDTFVHMTKAFIGWIKRRPTRTENSLPDSTT